MIGAVFPLAPAARQQPDERVSWISALHVGLVALYVSFAGIFWFGRIPTDLIANAKIGLFAIIVAIGLVGGQRYTRDQGRLLGWLWVCAIAAFVTDLATGTAAEAIDAARSFIEPALWLMALIGIKPNAYRLLFRLLLIGLFAFLAVAMYPVIAFADLAPNLEPPAGFINPAGADVNSDAFQAAISVIAGGFNGSRTGWGSTIAQSALMLIALVTMVRSVSNMRLAITLLVIAAAMASIIVTGARGGSLSLFVLAMYAIAGRITLSPTQRSAMLFFAVFGGILVVTIGFTIVLPQDYFRGFSTSGSTFDVLNSATTGRFDTYIGAFENFFRSPIYGVGAEDSQVFLPSGEFLLPHNVWLRFLSQSGLMLFVPLIVVTVRLIRILLKRMGELDTADLVRERLPDTSLIVICGILLALSEPAVIFGSMNANIPFWTAMWVLTIPFVVTTDLQADTDLLTDMAQPQ